ncbi:hypothetical protein [Streptomyces sp. NPDC047869]
MGDSGNDSLSGGNGNDALNGGADTNDGGSGRNACANPSTGPGCN